MTILVTGATGNVGANVVRDLVAHGVPVRAFVRDRDKALPMLGDRTDLLVGDLADTDAIHRAVQGVDRVFLACGNVPGQVQYERAVIDAAKDAGVTRVVKLSSPRPALDSPLVFDRWHAEIERHLVRSGLRSVMLRPRTYMTNVLGYAEGIAQTGRIFAPAGAARISFIDPRDVAAAAAAALTADEPLSEIYTLTGRRRSASTGSRPSCRRRRAGPLNTSMFRTRPPTRRCSMPGCRPWLPISSSGSSSRSEQVP